MSTVKMLFVFKNFFKYHILSQDKAWSVASNFNPAPSGSFTVVLKY